MSSRTGRLAGKVALVAGATRGTGRGIARMLGAQGATVVCTGRSTRANRQPRRAEDAPFALNSRPETVEETAELVTAAGGRGLVVVADHTDEAQVEALFARVQAEQGRLDLLVNDVWGGDELTEWGTPFWKQSMDKARLMLERGLLSHLLTSRHGVPLMVAQGSGLVVEVTDGIEARYRGCLPYDLVKHAVIRLANGMSHDLRGTGVVALCVTPGFLRSEAMLEHFGVAEANWRDATAQDPHFIASETPCFLGRAVAELAADPKIAVKAGGAFSSWGLSDEYGFTDIDGERPHWGRYFTEHIDTLEALTPPPE